MAGRIRSSEINLNRAECLEKASVQFGLIAEPEKANRCLVRASEEAKFGGDCCLYPLFEIAGQFHTIRNAVDAEKYYSIAVRYAVRASNARLVVDIENHAQAQFGKLSEVIGQACSALKKTVTVQGEKNTPLMAEIEQLRKVGNNQTVVFGEATSNVATKPQKLRTTA